MDPTSSSDGINPNSSDLSRSSEHRKGSSHNDSVDRVKESALSNFQKNVKHKHSSSPNRKRLKQTEKIPSYDDAFEKESLDRFDQMIQSTRAYTKSTIEIGPLKGSDLLIVSDEEFQKLAVPPSNWISRSDYAETCRILKDIKEHGLGTECRILIDPDDDDEFKEAMLADLRLLATRPAGRRLIHYLARPLNAKDPVKRFLISPTAKSDGAGPMDSMNKITVYINRERAVGAGRSWDVLAHELIHALHDSESAVFPEVIPRLKAADHPATVSAVYHNVEEQRTITGLTDPIAIPASNENDDNWTEALDLETSEPTYQHLFENLIRAEHGVLPRTTHTGIIPKPDPIEPGSNATQGYFCHCVATGNVSEVRSLLDAGVDMQLGYEKNGAILRAPFLAINFNQHKVFQLLVERGLPLEPHSKSNSSFLHIAARAGAVDTFKILLKAHGEKANELLKQTDANGHTPFFYSFSLEKPALLRDPTQPSISTLIAERFKNDHKALSSMLSETTRNGTTLLDGVAAKDRADDLDLLLKLHSSLGHNIGSLLPVEISSGSYTPAVLDYILERPEIKTYRDKSGRNIVHIVANSQNPVVLKKVLQKYPDLASETDHMGQTPLHLLMRRLGIRLASYEEVEDSMIRSIADAMRELLDAGADADVSDGVGAGTVADYFAEISKFTIAEGLDLKPLQTLLAQSNAKRTTPKHPLVEGDLIEGL